MQKHCALPHVLSVVVVANPIKYEAQLNRKSFTFIDSSREVGPGIGF